METDLIIAKNIIENKDKKLINYKYHYPIYLFTNENIKGIVDQLNLKDKNILTVCSSGDQLLNFLLEGAKSIEVFDINILTKYLYYLKRSAIINLDYEEFLKFFIKKIIKHNNIFNLNTYNKLRKDLPNDAKSFWDYLLINYPKDKLYRSNLFMKHNRPIKTIIKCNKYLNNNENYMLLKEKLINTNNIKFHNLDIFTEEFNISSPVDFIYLSNILDDLTAKTKKEYLEKIKAIIVNLSKLLTKNGIISLDYLYCYEDDYWLCIKTQNLQALRQEDNFIKNECQTIKFAGSVNITSKREQDKDAILLYRKK